MSRHPRPVPLGRRPSVSVVVPCYNYGHYLPKALETVLSQSGVDIEAIVIDDASPDNSGRVVQALANADPRIKPILHERNHGHIATYNEGLEQATGDYLVLMSADDALTPGSLARATALLEAEPSVGFSYGFPVVFTGEYPDVPLNLRGWTVWKGEEWLRRRCDQGGNCIYNPEVVMRTSVQRAIGGYDPKLPHAGDLEMWLRAATVADVGRVNGPGQAFYRVHDKSMQRTVYAGYVNDLEGRLDSFRKTLVDPGSKVANGAALYDVARKALANSALDYARLAYEHGRADEEPVAEYIAFAVRVWPSICGSRKWRGVEKRAQLSAERLRDGFPWKARRFATDLNDRVRWRTWRRYGV